MGTATTALLEAFSIPYAVLQPDLLEKQLQQAATVRGQGLPFFLLVPRETIERPRPRQAAPVNVSHTPEDDRLTRPVVVAALMKVLTSESLVTTTGYLSRQAHFESDRNATFYMHGSMGHAAAIGLGLATSPAGGRVVVLDGDGAFLMHLGTGSTIGAVRPEALVHIVVDNHCYESTGCQAGPSGGVHWDFLGRGLGYRTILSGNARGALHKVLTEAIRAPGPVLCVLEVQPTPGDHPRAASSASPEQMTRRFRTAVAKQRSGLADVVP